MTGKRSIFILAIAGMFALTACGKGTAKPAAVATATPMATHMATTPSTMTKAADLRTKLDILLGEHMILTAKATDAALGGRTSEFQAYAKQLNSNGTDLGAMIGAAFGMAAQNQFNSIWSAHIGFFVDYTNAVAKHDMAARQAAMNKLNTQYVPQFAKLISGATGLPQSAVASLTADHVAMTEKIINDQAAGNWPAAYAELRMAYAHMQMIGDALAPAIAAKNPSAFPGNPMSKAVGLRVALNQLFQEHLYLATMATGAALGGRTTEFAAASNALNQNGTDIGAAIGSLYGSAAQAKFNAIWSAHNGFFVDYTKAVAANNAGAKQQAVNDLMDQYVPQFAAFLAGATDLPKATLEALTRDHVMTTAAVVDAQATKDWPVVAAKDRMAAQHMQMIADPLAQAIVAKLPNKFM